MKLVSASLALNEVQKQDGADYLELKLRTHLFTKAFLIGLSITVHKDTSVDLFCPVLLDTIIKGDPQVKEANIICINPETTVWIKNPNRDHKGELAKDIKQRTTYVSSITTSVANHAGIKALSKTLNFQVQFSETTLYTPINSTKVGACSWGKSAAVQLLILD